MASYSTYQTAGLDLKLRISVLTVSEHWLDARYQEQLKQSRRDHWLISGNLPNGQQVGTFSKEAIKELLLQRLPGNGCDAAFLSHLYPFRTCNEIQAILMTIAFEEAGNGKVDEHHSNLFYRLVNNNILQLPPVEDFAQIVNIDRIIDSAFDDPVFQLAIGRFPNRFFPEILGMTLMLEWTGSLEALRMVKVLKKYGIDSKFYQVHVLADNIKNGHGQLAKQAIIMYLDQIKNAQGKAQMQIHWERIYRGFRTWERILDEFEQSLVNHLINFDGKTL